MINNYILELDGFNQGAPTLAYAKALAPQMFQRAGTQALFKKIRIIHKQTGRVVGWFGRLGWVDEPMVVGKVA